MFCLRASPKSVPLANEILQPWDALQVKNPKNSWLAFKWR